MTWSRIRTIFILLFAVLVFPPTVMVFVGWKTFLIVTIAYVVLYAVAKPFAFLIWLLIFVVWGAQILAALRNRLQPGP